MPQPLKPGIDGHQRRHNLYPVMAGAAAGVWQNPTNSY
ncbi:hypothetical protein LTSEADE_0008, partial [Salmonella enterica subsp. enterica serovar Adelaide str. A4-669]